jgi:N-acetylglucosaminyldiphosphoundecaprenol N-acetyl-beta-D-mannosaminyltransferase
MSKLSEIKLCVNYDDFLLKLKNFSENKSKGYCCLVNPNILINCYSDKTYFKTLKAAAFNVCDAISIEIINNLTKKRKIKSSPGPDIFKDLTIQNTYSQFFIGGENEIQLSSLKNNLANIKFKSTDFYCPPFLDVKDFDYIEISKLINNNKPDIIWIGLGAPKQEIFMSKLLPHIDSGLMIGVGAAFNFYSGYKNQKRAPLFYRRFKIEWLFRLINEPNKTFPRVLRNVINLPIILIKEFK